MENAEVDEPEKKKLHLSSASSLVAPISASSPIHNQCVTDTNSSSSNHEEEAEYVLIDLDSVSDQLVFPPNAPYVLSGLDTMNPVLIIDNKVKLIGEYQETIGTCLIFLEVTSLFDAAHMTHEEKEALEANLASGSGKSINGSMQSPTKEAKPVCQLQKVLKFKLSPDFED